MLRLHRLAEARKQYLLNGSNENVRDDIKHLMLTSSILRGVAVDVEVVYPTSGVDSRSQFVSRDVNAALNILACFVNPQRREFLRRRTELCITQRDASSPHSRDSQDNDSPFQVEDVSSVEHRVLSIRSEQGYISALKSYYAKIDDELTAASVEETGKTLDQNLEEISGTCSAGC
eukprot:762808-Hanusia_phi.AAC.3